MGTGSECRWEEKDLEKKKINMTPRDKQIINMRNYDYTSSST